MSELAVGNGNELPDSWTTAALEDVATLSPRFSAMDIDATDLVHFVPMAAVAENFGGIDVSQLRPYGDVRKGYTSFSESDVLFAKITPCMENGKGALVPHLPHKHAFGSTEFHVLRPEGAVLPKWLAHYLSQPDFRQVASQNMAGTAGQLRVPTKWLAIAGIPVPPLAEQTRIVEKLEELLSDLDAAVAELKAAQRKLAQYRQSLLKAAVEGALTAGWRAARHSYDHPPRSSSPRKRGSTGLAYPGVMDSRFRGNDGQSETGADLLQRILTERRARWETRQLTKFAEQGKTPPKGWQAKYPEPIRPNATELPALPLGWAWASVDQLAELVSGHTPKDASQFADETGDVCWFKVGDMNAEGNEEDLCAATIRFAKATSRELGLRTVPAGTIVFPKRGGAIATNKKRRLAIAAAYDLNMMGLVPVSSVADWLWSWFMGVDLAKLSDGSNIPQINNPDVAPLCVPLPPVVEQTEIIATLDTMLVAMKEQQTVIEHALKQSSAQRKNILKAAFAGQLVPQDPNDEPASVLLERIRAERAAQGTSSKKRGRTPRTSA